MRLDIGIIGIPWNRHPKKPCEQIETSPPLVLGKTGIEITLCNSTSKIKSMLKTEAPSTLMHFRLKTHTFLCVFAYRPHYWTIENAYSVHLKTLSRRCWWHLKTELYGSRVDGENGGFRKCWCHSNRRLHAQRILVAFRAFWRGRGKCYENDRVDAELLMRFRWKRSVSKTH